MWAIFYGSSTIAFQAVLPAGKVKSYLIWYKSFIDSHTLGDQIIFCPQFLTSPSIKNNLNNLNNLNNHQE